MEVARAESAMSSTSTEGSGSMAGYLLKKSGKKFVKWKKRWFSLRTEVLLYYENERALQSKGNLDLRESRGLRKWSEIKKMKNLPKSANEELAFGIAVKKKVVVVCALDSESYRDWTWALHTAITQSNPEVVQQSIGQFVGNRTDPFVFLGDDSDLNESDSSSSGEEFIATSQTSRMDLESIQKHKRHQKKNSNPRLEVGPEERVQLVQTPEGLRMSKPAAPKLSNSLPRSEVKLPASPSSRWNSPRYALKDRFTATTQWEQDTHSAPTTPTSSSSRLITSGFSTVGRRSKDPNLSVRRTSTPLDKVRSSLSKLSSSSSMQDLREVVRPGSAQGRAETAQGSRPSLKRSSSGNSADAEQRAQEALQECRDEVSNFHQQMERFLGRRVDVTQDLTRLVEDLSLHPNGFRRFKGLKETVRSVLQNMYKGLATVAEPSYVRQEAARILGKFQFTLYQIPHNPKAPAKPTSSLMLQTLRGRALDWDCPDPPSDCCLHYYLQLQLTEGGQRLLDILTVFQCEVFWENLLRGWESKFSLQIETGVLKWQSDLEKHLGRSVGVFVDTVELLREVPEQTLRYKAVEAVGSNFCKDSVGRIVEILENLVDSQLTKIQLRKRLRYIELGPLPADSKEEKSVKWCEGGLLVRAKWHNGVRIEYGDVFQCLESVPSQLVNNV